MINIRALAVTTFIALAGCTGMPPAADKAVLFNKAVEDASNQLVLLNVLRASQRMPIYYTRLSNLQSVGALKSGVTSTFQLGPRSSDILGLSIPLGADQTDTVGVQVLDDQKFIQGILDRAKPETLSFYLAQGWPKDLLFHLFIERIEIEETYFKEQIKPAVGTVCDSAKTRPARSDKGELETNTLIDNSPFDGFDCFQKVIRLFDDKFNIDLVQRSAFKPTGLTALNHSARFAAPVVEALKAGYVLTKTNVPSPSPNDINRKVCGLAIGKSTSTTVFQLDPPKKALEKYLRHPIVDLTGVAAQALGTDEQQDDTRCETKATKPGDLPIVFFLRSPDSMIYYLGEILRAQKTVEGGESNSVQVRTSSAGKLVDMFKVLKDRPGIITVDFQGSTYSIPPTYPADDHRSTQVIGLLIQLIALQKEAGAAPSLPPVTVIN